jgi:hypothetical protein
VRLAVLRSGLAVLASLAAICVLAAPAPAQSLVQAHSARAFGDSIGVNVRLTYLDTSYGDFNGVQSRLRELGVRYVSDSICPTCEYQIDRLQRLAAVGIKANLGVGWLSGGTATIGPGLQAIRTRLRDSAASISTVNEPDISGDPDWIAKTRAFQAEAYRQAKADPFLSQLPVLGPSLVNRASRAALGDLSPHLDRGNLHPYPGGLPPLGNLADESLLTAQVSGAKPLVISEVGYHTDLSYSGPHRPASEQAVAVYMPRTALEAFSHGIERTYIYTLADLWPTGQAPAHGSSASEDSFGLLRWDLSPKPSFLALRNLLRAVDGDSAPVAAPGGMRLAVEGAGADVRQLLLRSADGSYALVLWRTVSVWDRDAQRDVAPAPDHVDVALGEPVTLAQRFDPVASAAETQRWTGPTRIPVELGGAPVVLRLVPPGAKKALAGARKGLRARGAARRCERSSPRNKKSKPKRSRAASRHGTRARATWKPACVKAGRRPRR